jgi:hypothetical protein
MNAFMIAVKKMRQNQKAYFKYRNQHHLEQAKKYEKEVDKIIEEAAQNQVKLL